MDVDPTTPKLPSKRPAEFPPASSSADKCAKISLPDGQLATLNSNMKKWQKLVDGVEANDSVWEDILPAVFRRLMQELASTDMKDNVIQKPSLDDCEKIVRGLTEGE